MLPASSPSRWNRAAPWLIVAALVLTFGRVVVNGISPIDDNDNIFHNPRMDSLNPPTLFGPRGVGVYWTHGVEHLYVPLAYTFWTLLAMASWTQTPDTNGLRIDPRLFHAASLLLHITNALLVYSLLRRLLRTRNIQSVWPAFAGALLFGLHPLQVETVAWTSGMKDLLYCTFSLLALSAYIRAAIPPAPGERTAAKWKRWSSYLTGIVLMVVGMLCKPTAMVVPVVALVIDCLILQRSIRKTVLFALPYMIVAVPIMVVAKTVQPAAGLPYVPLWQRPVVASASLMFYLSKLLAPMGLGFDYGWQPTNMLHKPWFWAMAATAGVIGIALLTLRRRFTWVFTGACVSVIALLPTLGLVPFDYQFYSTVADHYVALAMLGPAIAIAGLLTANRGTPTTFTVVPAVILAILCGSASFMQIGYWRTPEELLHHMVAVNPDSALAWNNLGKTYAIHGDYADAESCFLRTENNPMELHGPENLAHLYAIQGKPDRAIAVLHRLYIVASRYPADARPDLSDLPEQLFASAAQNHHYLSLPWYGPDVASMWLAAHVQPSPDNQAPTFR